MMATSDDPIRADVERVLRSAVEASICIPFTLATAVPRCLLRSACALRRQLAEPLRIARSLLDLVGGGRPIATGPDSPPVTGSAARAPADAWTKDSAVRPPAASDDLPIEEYESLAASQVVDRLGMLTPDELEAIRSFEMAHRGRRTVLGKIDQLVAPA